MLRRFVLSAACVGLAGCAVERPPFGTPNLAEGLDASAVDAGVSGTASDSSSANFDSTSSSSNTGANTLTYEGQNPTGSETSVDLDGSPADSNDGTSTKPNTAQDASDTDPSNDPTDEATGADPVDASDNDTSDTDTSDPDDPSDAEGTADASNPDETSTDEGSSNTSNDSGPARECDEEQTRSCWEDEDGNPITDDPADAIGNCQLGEQACTANGTWGPCVGAIAPEAEDECNSSEDDNNCNGTPNDGCDCLANDTRPCGTDDGPCSVGVQSCGPDNKWSTECVGGVAAQSRDSCAVVGDDANCNQEENDDCECIGDETLPCNDCGVRTCDTATGRFGTCGPAPEAVPRCNSNDTGIQTCDSEGFWQTVACTNSDVTNCTVSCQDSGGTPACVHVARDGDDDGYRSQACAASPGDDCDDTTQLVSPGATEICDGADNDCDGFPDAMDSTIRVPSVIAPVRFTSAATVPNLRRLDITWHDEEFFFLADGNEHATYKSIYSGYARTDGTVVLREEEVLAASDGSQWYDSPRVASAGGVLGAVVRTDGRGYGTLFLTLDADGTVLTNTSASTSYSGGDIINNGSSFTLATFSQPFGGTDLPYTFNFNTGSTSGTSTSAATQRDLTAGADALNIAYAGSTAAVAYTDPTTSSAQLMRLVAGTIQGPTQLSTSAQSADITATSNGKFAVVWANATGFRLQVRETNGTTVSCDSQNITFGNGILDAMDGVTVAQSSVGLVVFATDNGVGEDTTSGEAAVFVFDLDCQQLTEQPKRLSTNVGNSATELPHQPRIAVGGGSIALAWTVQQSNNMDEYQSYIHVLPEDMCQ